MQRPTMFRCACGQLLQKIPCDGPGGPVSRMRFHLMVHYALDGVLDRAYHEGAKRWRVTGSGVDLQFGLAAVPAARYWETVTPRTARPAALPSTAR